MPRPLALTTFEAPFAWATRGKRSEFSVAELEATLTTPELWPGDIEPAKAESSLPGWSGALFRDDARIVHDNLEIADAENVVRVDAITALILDYDDEPAADQDTLARWWAGYTMIAYTTASHMRPWRDRPPGPHWVVIVPLLRPVSLEVGGDLARWARHPRNHKGTIAESSERVWRAVARPAMNPGGFHGKALAGAAVDPDRALKQLADWRDADRCADAQRVLGDGLLMPAIFAFAQRLTAQPGADFPALDAHRSIAFELAPLPTDVGVIGGAPRPGRLSVLVGPANSGRGCFALELAANTARAGHPVLFVSARMTKDEGVARLVAWRVGPGVSAEDVLSGACKTSDLALVLESLQRDLPSLAFWTPRLDERDATNLGRVAKAASDFTKGTVPLIVIDAIESWDLPESGLAAALFDVMRPGSLAPSWPGAEIVALDRPPSVWPTAKRLLKANADDRAAVPVPTGPVAREASRILGIAFDRQSHRATLCVLRDRLGPGGALALEFDPTCGRFRRVADSEASHPLTGL